MQNVGYNTRIALNKVVQWMPDGALMHVYQAYWDRVASEMVMDITNVTLQQWQNITKWMNWTECTLQMLYVYHQRTKVQSLILRQNNHEYKNFGTFQSYG